MVAQKYSIKTGILKSLKNLAVIVGIPAVLLFLDNWTQIIPSEWSSVAAPIMGFASYFVKNYIENKGK